MRLGEGNLRWWIRAADGRIMVVRCHGCGLAENLRRTLQHASDAIPRGRVTPERVKGLLSEYEERLERALDEYEVQCEKSREWTYGRRFARPGPSAWADVDQGTNGMEILLAATPPPVSDDGPGDGRPPYPPLPPGWNATRSNDEKAWYYWPESGSSAQWEAPTDREGAAVPRM